MGEDEFGFGGFEGISEAPLPEYPDDMAADSGDEVLMPADEDTGVAAAGAPPQESGGPIMPSGRPPRRKGKDYSAAASKGGARAVGTKPSDKPRQSGGPPGSTADVWQRNGQQGQQQGQRPPNGQRRGRQPLQQAYQQGQQGGQQRGQPGPGQQRGPMQGQRRGPNGQQMGQQMGPNGQQYGQNGQQMGPNGQLVPAQPEQGKKSKNPFKRKKNQPVPQQPNQPVRGGGGPGGPGGGGGPGVDSNMLNNAGKKKKKKFPLIPILLIILLAVAALFLVRQLNGGGSKEPPLEPVVQSYESSGRRALDTLLSALNSYDPMGLDAIVGEEDGDSYLAQEWAYVNNVKIRQEFLQTVGSIVTFEYPMVQQMSTTGVGMTDEYGNPIMIESYMNAGEEFMITVPDYYKLSKTMEEKKDYIEKMMASAKYQESDYDFANELTNLMLQFILDDGPLPTKQVSVSVPLRMGSNGTPIVEDDAVLDDVLFGNEDLRYMCKIFSQICVGYTGFIEETYLEYERQHNEEYDRWLELFLAYFESDGGIYDPEADPPFQNVRPSFHPSTSKWEPWYLRDDNNVIQTYPDGTYIVNYFSVKDENGNDWIQPAEEIEVEVEKVRNLEDPWEEERGIWYNWIGVHWLLTEYNGKGSTLTRVGDGSREHPAGIGTEIITKVLCTDGEYHAVKVALLGYWLREDAINYSERFSTKNRGFTTASVVQLITYEVSVENLEEDPIEFISSEMTLCDKNGNISARTGTMYAFTELVNLNGRKVVDGSNKIILNDWATSTELDQKYVTWGKTFGKKYNMVYFNVLAGTGNIPSYSAYKQFTGQSSIDEEIKGTSATQEKKTPSIEDMQMTTGSGGTSN